MAAEKRHSHGSGAAAIDLDDVLVNELGQFGKFQMTNIALVVIPIAMSAVMSEYIFGAAALPHRCTIPQCDAPNTTDFSPSWVLNAIPPLRNESDDFVNCERYVYIGGDAGDAPDGSRCPADWFDQSRTESCEEGFVFERTNSVVYDFDLACEEWLRALAGTLSSTGTLLVLPFTGYVSDKFGRRVALVISVFNLALFGLIRAFSVNYPMYLAFQLLQTTLGGGTFTSAYIFATELVGPKYRVLTSATMSSMFAFGQVILASVSWLVQPWRYMIIALHVPCFLIIAYYWILSESVRWLLSKRKFEEAKQVLEKVARVNKTQISEKTMQALLSPPGVDDAKVDGEPGLFTKIVRSPTLLRRICTTPVWWITTTFIYYGLSINSVGLSLNMYVNYILISAIEIPGYYTAVLVLNRIGRKATISGGYMTASVCCFAFAFMPDNLETAALIVFLIGKFAIAVVFTSLYLYTSELYPTQYRHTLLAFSSMIGRIGSITAPLTPALMQYGEFIPSMMFGIMGLISGVLVLTQPETLGTKMPDTLEQAEQLGKKHS